ncbi:MAG: MinD/ParA family protein [Planctomycetes bacterium]|nr:MinD/ParA family protein [Planctomycetota bacterium]
MDQAEGLRLLARQTTRPARVLAVCSGKGGVGKSNVALNLALAASLARRRTILIDIDLGLANVDVLCDVHARVNLSHVIAGRASLSEACVAGPGGLKIVPGASGIERLANLGDVERERLLSGLEELQRQAEFLIIDTGAGISKNVLAFVGAADDILLVTTPEPTALVDAYAMLKMLAQRDVPGSVFVCVNCAEHRVEADRVAAGLRTVAERFLNLYVEPLGWLPRDAAVPSSVRRKQPFLLACPDAPVSHALREMAGRAFGPRGEESAVPAGPSAERSFFARVWEAFRAPAT